MVFDQSLFVKQAISTVLREGGIGLLLTAVMILIFLGSPRATAAVFLSIPLSVMVTFFSCIRAIRPSTAWSSAAWRWLSRV